VLGLQLDSMISEVFYNLNDSMILRFHDSGASKHKEAGFILAISKQINKQ